MSPLSKRGRVRALQNLGILGRLWQPRMLSGFTELSRRESREMDGQPKG